MPVVSSQKPLFEKPLPYTHYGMASEETFDYHTTTPRDSGTFDIVLDTVGKDLRTYCRLLAPGGRMIAAIIAEPGDAAYVAASTVFGTRRVGFVQKPPTHELLASLSEYVDKKAVKPIIDSMYTLEDIAAAHRAQEAGKGFGKRVVRLIWAMMPLRCTNDSCSWHW